LKVLPEEVPGKHERWTGLASSVPCARSSSPSAKRPRT
jgi:hypothetical protein